MKLLSWQSIGKLRELLKETAPSPEEMALRLRTVERDIILPVKAVFIGILILNFHFSHWFEDVAVQRYAAQEIVGRFFLIYLFFNVAVAYVLIFPQRFRSLTVGRVIFVSNFVDGLFLAALTFVTGGFDSMLYWLFLALIVRNAVSIPLAVPQIILNFSVSFWYFCAGLLDVTITDDMLDYDEISTGLDENPTEPFLLRLTLLWLMTACCYGVQVLFEKQRRAEEEARESVGRQEHLRSAGRLAAQIAHQIKNPLAIINNAAYSLQRALAEGKDSAQTQLKIIREEVERSDQIITKLMGYAQLAEGKVEKLDVTEAMDQAIQEVFPAGAYGSEVEKDYSFYLPSLLMQRGHLSEMLVNLLQNAREATNGGGKIHVQIRPGESSSLIISIKDNGPGIPPERLEKVFEPYFSTKEKGTGLGLSIVKHNAEIYSGTIKVQSELGKGALFTLQLPTRTFMKL